MRNTLKIFAILFMLLDHIGLLFYPDIFIFRLLGRLSYPLFAYLLVLGFRSSHDRTLYLFRLLAFGFISQIPFSYINDGFNIFFTLGFGLIALIFFEFKKPLVLIPIILSSVIPLDYGVFGVLLVVLFNLRNKLLSYSLIIISTLILYEGIQIYSLGALLLIELVRLLNFKPSYRFKYKLAFYGFYPLHILVLLLIKSI